MRFLAEFDKAPIYFLLAAGFTNLLLNFWIDASIILGVVVVNALLGFIEQGRERNAQRSKGHVSSHGDPAFVHLFFAAQANFRRRSPLPYGLVSCWVVRIVPDPRSRKVDHPLFATVAESSARKRMSPGALSPGASR